MTAASTSTAQQPFTKKTSADKSVRKPISWETFQREYLSREDNYKYEWVNGQVEKTKRSIDKTQLFMLDNLLEFFENLKQEGKVNGRLIPEPDLFFLSNHRRPGVAWLTKEQIRTLASPGAYEVPAFIIEVISSNDQINAVKEKMGNYRDAGVQVVWQVFPKFKQVEVYSGEKLNESKVCEGDDICSAAPALPGFAMPVKDIFYLPEKKT